MEDINEILSIVKASVDADIYNALVKHIDETQDYIDALRDYNIVRSTDPYLAAITVLWNNKHKESAMLLLNVVT